MTTRKARRRDGWHIDCTQDGRPGLISHAEAKRERIRDVPSRRQASNKSRCTMDRFPVLRPSCRRLKTERG